MLEKSMGLLFYLKKRGNYVKGELPIYLRVTINGVAKEVTTKRNCSPDRWNADAQRVKGTNEAAKSINAFLDALILNVHEVRRQLMEDKKPVSADAIKNILLGRSEAPKMLLEIFQNHNDQMKALVGKEYSPGTLERYKTSLEHTRSFIKTTYRLTDIDITTLDYQFVAEYEFWLKSARGCNHNSSIKYISNFRKIVNKCLRSGWLSKDPFIGFKMTKREVERIALTQDELDTITNKSFSTQRLTVVRDIFVFSCYTGLSYADVHKLRKSEIVKGLDGKQWIHTHRQKTETASRIPLLPAAERIIDKYADNAHGIDTGSVLPVLSNQKMNAYLKEIADVCGLQKTLTFHLARHTFATAITLANGVRIESVSKMLGHRNLTTTQHYAKILDKQVSDDMQLLRQKLIEAN